MNAIYRKMNRFATQSYLISFGHGFVLVTIERTSRHSSLEYFILQLLTYI
jgi:hypothetical protein